MNETINNFKPFDTIAGFNQIQEIENYILRETIIITMDDIWSLYRKRFPKNIDVYFKNMISKSRAYIDNDVILHHPTRGNLNPTNENINISSSWIVSQYKGEYNPWHQHSGHLSAVIYLKLPKGMMDFYKKIKPPLVVPMHGEIRHLIGHKRVLAEKNIRAEIVRNGEIIEIDEDLKIKKDATNSPERLFLDGKIIAETTDTVKVTSDTASSADVIVSALEQT